MGNASADPIKERVERQIAEGFLPLYNHVKGGKLKILGAGVPPEPDILCQDAWTDEEVGIEVTVAYNRSGLREVGLEPRPR